MKRCLVAGLLALVLLSGCGGSHEQNGIVLVDHTWTCTGHVDLNLVQVTMRPKAADRDAVHLRSGCSGHIGRLVVEQWVGDGVKVAQGVHDLTVDGGSIRCYAKAPTLHQDGIQAMGGSHILFRDLSIDCGREHDRLINSNLFIKQAGRSTSPPRDIVCDGCRLGGGAAHTADIQASVGSGLRDSTLCEGRFPRLTLTIGPGASDPVNSGNHIRRCDS